MKFARFAWFGSAVLALNACVGPDGSMPPAGGMTMQGGYPQSGSPSATNSYPASAYPPSPAYPAVQPPNSYTPEQRDEYRSGYDIGAKDRSLGYLSDPRRAFARFGRSSEADFNEGYSDGFNDRAMKH